MEEEKEIQWRNGKDEYSRQEVENMLNTQRAMIFNDLISLLNGFAADRGKSGILTHNEKIILATVKRPRKVNFEP